MSSTSYALLNKESSTPVQKCIGDKGWYMLPVYFIAFDVLFSKMFVRQLD